MSNWMKEQRDAKRRELAQQITPQSVRLRLPGLDFVGRDASGAKYQTKSLETMGVIITGPFARISFYRDEKDFFDSVPARECDAVVRKGMNPKRPLVIDTDVYKAVRLFKHIKEGYREEFKQDGKISEFEILHTNITDTPFDKLKEIIERTLVQLKEFEGSLPTSQAASKDMARIKLRMAIELLEDSLKQETSFKFMNRVNTACACLCAFSNRYEEWRIKEILRRGSMAVLRETGTRRLRDGYMLSVIKDLNPQNLPAIRHFVERDQQRMILLEGLNIKNIQDILTELEFSRLRFGARNVVAARYNISVGNTDLAIGELKRLLVLLRSNKPLYIAEQIEKTGDNYLCAGGEKSFVAYIKKGAQLLTERLFQRADYCFRKAEESLVRLESIK